jgi:hypothetical protein
MEKRKNNRGVEYKNHYTKLYTTGRESAQIFKKEYVDNEQWHNSDKNVVIIGLGWISLRK